MKKHFILSVELVAIFCCSMFRPANSQPTKSEWSFAIGKNSNSIDVKNANGMVWNCKLNSDSSSAILSFDQKTLIVSGNGYVSTDDLINCGNKVLSVKFTPAKNGFLVDFNFSNKRYLSLDFVALRPTSYIAYVGELGKKRSLVTLPGAYAATKTLKKMQQEAFGYSDDLLAKPKISVNGRYVTVTGELDCSADSHPGVWDAETNKKVIIKQNPDILEQCKALFFQ